MATPTGRRIWTVGTALMAAGIALALLTLGITQAPLWFADDGGIDDVFVARMLELDAETWQIARLADTHAEHTELRLLAKDIMRSIREDGAVMGSRRAQISLPFLQPAGGPGADRQAVIRAPVFDKAFIEVMVSRYQKGVDWCRQAMATAKTARTRMLASDLIASRARELVLMRLYYQAWYGTPSAP